MKKSIAIIGGGIAGLTAAFRLRSEDVDLVLFEGSPRTGGVIRTDLSDGYLVEHGPNTIQTSSVIIEDLIRSCGLVNHRVEADPAAKKRYVVRGGIPKAIPMSPGAFLSTSLFSWQARFRILREPFVPAVSSDIEETVAEFVERRLGKEMLDYAINPFVAGVYAGDPGKLALKHAFPRLYRLEQEYGSLIRGMIKKARAAKSKASPAPQGKMISFTRGLQMLPDALVRILGSHVRTGTRVVRMQHLDGKWQLTLEQDGGVSTHVSDTIIYTAPLYQLPTVFSPASNRGAVFTSLAYPPVSILALGYKREQVAHPLDGFGMLVPEVEKDFRILGTLFSSTLFAGRAPEDHVLLTSFIGGTRHAALASESTDRLIDLTVEDLSKLLGIRDQPVFASRVFRKYAIPQYNLGYGSVKSMIEELEGSFPGLFFAGNYREGISVSDTITCATNTALRVIDARVTENTVSG